MSVFRLCVESALCVAKVWLFLFILFAENVRTAEPSPKEKIDRLQAQLGSSLPEVRQLAAEGLGKLGLRARASAPALTRALADPNPGVRAAAAVALTNIQRGDAVPALIKALAGTTDVEARTTIIRCFVHTGSKGRDAVPI